MLTVNTIIEGFASERLRSLHIIAPHQVYTEIIARTVRHALDERLTVPEVTKELHAEYLNREPEAIPLRAPHHSVGEMGMFGNNSYPGETLLAHGGILLLSEYPEFRRSVVASVHEYQRLAWAQRGRPSRKSLSIRARFRLIALSAPCPCGSESCRCTNAQRKAFRERLSAHPFDLTIEGERVVSDLISQACSIRREMEAAK